MTPFGLFSYIVAGAFGAGICAILGGLLYLSWLALLGWVKGGGNGRSDDTSDLQA